MAYHNITTSDAFIENSGFEAKIAQIDFSHLKCGIKVGLQFLWSATKVFKYLF
jgi:hypothetical protein